MSKAKQVRQKNRELLVELRRKKKLYDLWKKGQA